MNTSNVPDNSQPRSADVPGWVALIIALIFWVILLPLVHAGIPWALSLLTPHYGWIDGHPATWNWLGLIPVALAAILLIWLMILHFSRIPNALAWMGNLVWKHHCLGRVPHHGTGNEFQNCLARRARPGGALWRGVS